MEPFQPVVDAYLDFARHAVDSPTFVEWSLGVADDAGVQRLIAGLPPIKQQPNLIFAAARWLGAAAPGPYQGFRDVVVGRWSDVVAVVSTRATQTNEVGRLATLVPAFATIGAERIALLEVGCSAGLCLHPDGYRYRWSSADSVVEVGTGPVLECRVSGAPSLPEVVPQIGWRGGIDLNPLDVNDPDHIAWLENLIFPEHQDRRDRLRVAVQVARRSPVEVVRGNLLTELPVLLDRVPSGLTPIVFHTAVIAYLEPDDRERFAAMMRELVRAGACHWVSNEGANVLPAVTASTGGVEVGNRFVLGVDGRAVGLTQSHGRALEWLV
ncbi:DUF2332 domain-containing protein [Nocardioides sp. Bht2]|uniref:DUF2332 domain-containing protein n=1 Tax=Nocardioides sp. Bht2 TaxID=3392297 RepID=UPI0039B46110